MKIFKVYTIILLFSLPIAVLCKDEKVAEEKEGNCKLNLRPKYVQF